MTRVQFKEHRIGNETFNLPARFIPKSILGKGAYGVVVEALDTETHERVAIKKNNYVFAREGNVLIPKRLLREMKILQHLEHPNIVNIKGAILPNSFEEFDSVTFVCDLMETDLRAILKSGQTLSDRHVQFIMFQLLAALNYTHSANILHRDLKPANVLINSNSRIKLCDFGLARGLDFDSENVQMSTNYVQTRWYRAPELLLNYPTVTKQVDMWSVGCMMAEMLTGKPILCGSSPIQQIEKIVNMLGTPTLTKVKASKEGVEFIKRMGYRPSRPLQLLFPTIRNPLAIDLLQKLLRFDPADRISAAEAIKHPYMASFYDESIVTTCPFKFDYGFEDGLTDVFDVKLETYATILQMNGYSAGEVSEAKAKIEKAPSPTMTDSIRSIFGIKRKSLL